MNIQIIMDHAELDIYVDGWFLCSVEVADISGEAYQTLIHALDQYNRGCGSIEATVKEIE